MKLMISGDLFDDVLIVFKQTEVPQIVEENIFVKDTFDKSLKLLVLAERVKLNTINGSPSHEPLLVCGN